jgi:LmbE family N-acetylglucosaminyl deacetylase
VTRPVWRLMNKLPMFEECQTSDLSNSEWLEDRVVNLPSSIIKTLTMKVLVVSVHPDDETIGCGGTLLKHKFNNDEIYCIYVTNGNQTQTETIPLINEQYGFEKTFQLGLPELDLDDISLNEIIPKIKSVFDEIRPNIVYVPNRSDVHSDHRKTFEALIPLIKTFRFPYIKKVLMCEVISETDFAPALLEYNFQPNVFVDISNFFEKKLNILKIFHQELMESPMTRSLDTLTAYNRYRGSQINSKYAEAFVLIKEIS